MQEHCTPPSPALDSAVAMPMVPARELESQGKALGSSEGDGKGNLREQVKSRQRCGTIPG